MVSPGSALLFTLFPFPLNSSRPTTGNASAKTHVLPAAELGVPAAHSSSLAGMSLFYDKSRAVLLLLAFLIQP